MCLYNYQVVLLNPMHLKIMRVIQESLVPSHQDHYHLGEVYLLNAINRKKTINRNRVINRISIIKGGANKYSILCVTQF